LFIELISHELIETTQINKTMTTIEFSYQLTGLEDKLTRFAMRLTSNREDAKDLMQETMLKAYTYRTHYEDCTNMLAWTCTIMKNIFINNYRRSMRHQTIFDNTNDQFFLNRSQYIDYSSPDSIYTIKQLNQIINSLKDEFKTPFKMHLDGYKYKEIADKLDLNIGTVKSRIFFARQKLMNTLSDLN